ncbi:MAG: hypothetical protein ACFFB0_08315 [Promethearchaeota archaeon]
MYNNMEESNPEYEDMLNKLSNQINDLFSRLHYYQALVAEKENQISRLTNEITQLKTLIKEMSNQSQPPPPAPYPSQRASISPTPKRPTTPPSYPSPQPSALPSYPQSKPSTSPELQRKLTSASISEDFERINKRKCPNCGAMGFAIKEVDDKTKIISYVPRRIYAKKKVCTKCRFEFV